MGNGEQGTDTPEHILAVLGVIKIISSPLPLCFESQGMLYLQIKT
jgi:hypothetical protein